MKTLTTLMVTLIILGATLYLREDPFRDGRFRVYDETWKPQGYVVRDRFCPNKFNVFDKDWNRTGRIEQDRDRWDLEDEK